MDPANFSELRKWLTEAGLAGTSETALLDGFCRRAFEAGLPLARATVIIDTLHPVHEGRVARWRREGDEGRTELIEYGPSSEGEAAENWRRSPFFICSKAAAPSGEYAWPRARRRNSQAL